MKDLKDYSIELESLDITLIESILDDDLTDTLDKVAATEWLNDHAKGKYKIKKMAGNSIKIIGDLIIDGFDGEMLPITIWDIQKGNLTIVNCPKLKSLKGFIEFSIDGGLYINNCPELESLEGCPKVIGGDFVCVGNRKIKSLAGAPQSVFGEIHIMKNGKKFSEEYIKTLIKDFERINCSDETEQPLITEALNEPHLLKLAQQLHDQRAAGVNNIKFSDILPCRSGIQYDKVTSKDVKVFRKHEEVEMLKVCRAFIADKVSGVILLQDKDGKYTDCIFRKNIYHIDAKYAWGRSESRVQTTNLLNYCKKAEKVITINLNDVFNYQIQSIRADAKSGMIVNTETQNEQIAKENIKRYKAMLAKKRAAAVADAEFDKIDEDVQDILTKVLLVSRRAHKDPAKYASDSYMITHLNELIYDQRTYSRGQQYGDNGILVLYNSLTTDYLRSQDKKDSFGLGSFYAESMMQIKKELIEKIKKVRESLAYFGL